MAFNTGAQLDNILLRGLNFRYPNNAPVSSFYSLYANGVGQTYWSNAITGENLSTLASSLTIQTVQLSSMISTIVVTNNQQSTSISTLYGAQFSSMLRLLSNDATLNSNINTLSNQFIVNSNINSIQFANYDYLVQSTLSNAAASASNYGPVYSSISTLQRSLEISVSTLSTTIGVQNTSTYYSLTDNYRAYASTIVISSVTSLGNQINTLNSGVNSLLPLLTFSSIITNQLISTNSGIQGQMSSLSSFLTSTISSLSTYTTLNLLSTSVNLQGRVSTLETFKNGISTTVLNIVAPYTALALASTTSTTLRYINQNSNAISTIQGNLFNVSQQASSLSSFVSSLYSAQQSTNKYLINNVSDLWFAYSTLTASSILVNIWSSFYNLEQYTSSVIGIRYSTISQYEYNVYQSTIAQNNSTSVAFYNIFVSSLYASTLSTLIPSTIAFTSSMVSTLYSTSYTYMLSTLTSSMYGIQSTYVSTSYGLNNQFIASTQYQVNSSLVGYIGVPANSTFSTIYYMTVSTFSTITANNNTQSTIFYSTQSYYNYSYSTLTGSTILTNNIANSTLSTVVFANTTQLAANSTVFGQQTSTQSVQFGSTIVSYNIFLTNTANAAAAAVVASTVNTANAAAAVVTNSTIVTYNAFVAGLNQGLQNFGTSSLYTFAQLNLTGASTTQFMNFSTYANYYVLVSTILPASTYRLTYDRRGVTNLNFHRGVISIDINTVGQPNTANGGQLRFDVNTLGVPTSVFKNVSPLIGNSDYLAQYEYTIMNNTVWTNLIGLYPRVQVRNPVALTTTPVIFANGVADPSTILRGGSLNVSWSNYSFFPYSTIGQLPFEPQVVLETYIGGSLIAEYGPYPFYVSTATIMSPYIIGSNAGGPLQPVTVNMYILGYPAQTTTTTFKMLQPTFDVITFQNYGYGTNLGTSSFVGGYELVAQTDSRNYPLYNIGVSLTGNLTNQPFNNSTIYSATNLTTNLINRAGAQGTARANQRVTYATTNFLVPGSFTEFSGLRSYPDYLFNVSAYQDLVAISSLGGTVTFTLNNGLISTTFLAANFNTIVSTFVSTAFTSTYTLYEVFNPNVSKPTNTFSSRGDLVSVQYSLTLPTFVSTAAGVTTNPFVGPVGLYNGNPYYADRAVTATLPNIGLSAVTDPVSSLIFYNVNNTPILATSTTGMLITAQMNVNGVRYTYSVSTTGSAAAQVFSF